MCDRGWLGIDDEYRIVIPQERFIEEAAVESQEMTAFWGEAIELPSQREFMPSLKGLQWHRERWGTDRNWAQYDLNKAIIKVANRQTGNIA